MKYFRTFLSFLIIFPSFCGMPALAANDTSTKLVGWLDGNISSKLVSLGTSTQITDPGIIFSPSNPDSGFQQTKTLSLNINLAFYESWFLKNSGYLGTLFGAGVAIMPVVGSSVVTSRFLVSEDEAKNLPDLQVPTLASDLAAWRLNDSIYYASHGGIIFTAAVGFAFTGVSGDYLAQGEWNTYIEKTGATQVYVKMEKAALTALELAVGNLFFSATLSDFGGTDEMFSFTFDLANAEAAAAYEAMIHGSILEAEALAQINSGGVQQVFTEKGGTSKKQQRFFLGMPFLNLSDTSGNLYNLSDTVFYQDGSKNEIKYGLYWNDLESDFFLHHESTSQSFYGVASNDGLDGKLILSYEDDDSDENSIPEAMADIIERTGLRDELKFTGVHLQEHAGYTHLSLTMDIPEITTRRLMALNANKAFQEIPIVDVVHHYFDELGDPERLCQKHVIPFADCQEHYRDETQESVSQMTDALIQMSAAESRGDSVTFVSEYAKFGQAMLKNELTFSIVTQIIGNNPFVIEFDAEGTPITLVNKNIEPGYFGYSMAGSRQ